jgi:TnpA family transposase
MENPMDEYNAGKGGTGSINGRKINHAATGTRLNRSMRGRGRGVSVIAVVSALTC